MNEINLGEPLSSDLTDSEKYYLRRITDATEAFLREALKDEDFSNASHEFKRGYALGLRESMAMFLELSLRECHRCFGRKP